ncbi:hypothetical protein [Aeromonas salmonicida]|uniref:glycan biosynthesis hexose transferase WsfD n=1 Tax=Aeromonas salmonicida TaxID=645 RepID=UPI0022408F6A|nr:hypothetical protein [Aeromonas salmonicida]
MLIMKRESVVYVAVLLLSLAIASMTKNLFMPNTGDFGRVIGWYLSSNLSDGQYFTLKIGDISAHNFMRGFDYKSSYTLLIYCYAVFLSYFTDVFDLRLLSAILKIIYIFSLFFLFSKAMDLNIRTPLLKFVVFLIAITPCISSSNLAFFSSFYQEQVVLICLPILLLCLIADKERYFLIIVAAVTIISCSKSQFFYFPIIIAIYYWLYKDRDIKKIIVMVSVFVLACTAIIKTNGTTELNRYHATYFGIYQLAEINGHGFPESVKKTCVGIDAWGNKFNLEYGAVPTEKGMACYNELKDKVSFLDVIAFFIKKPQLIFTLPFDKGVSTQLSENYFHVYFSYKVIGNNTGALANVTIIKDALFDGNRLPALFLVLPLSIILRKKRTSGACFILASFAITQFYISFIGEGYRDLSKHLFAMNFAFDLMVSILTVVCVGNVINKIAIMRASNNIYKQTGQILPKANHCNGAESTRT